MNIPKKVLLLIVTLLTITLALISLRWRIEHDTPILLYVSFLIDRYHLVPYKDIFDFNMPGTYFAYYLIGRLSGYADLPIRFVDLAILIAMLSMTWFLMKQVDRMAAWAALCCGV